MNIILLNEDNLNQQHPVFNEAKLFGAYKTIYVFDEELMKALKYSFKKVVFNYESLKEIECEIYKGKTLEVLQQIKPRMIFIPETDNHYYCDMYDDLKQYFDLKLVKEDNKFKPSKVHKRFFSYYKEFKKEQKL